MDTKLIYTYKKGLHHLLHVIDSEDIVAIYRECIIQNNKFYKSVIYTTSDSVHLFEDIVDEVKIIDSSYDVFFQDDLKFYVLQNENAPFTIIDGDIILDNKLNITNEEVVYEKTVSDVHLFKMRQYLLDYNVEDYFNYWKNYDYTYNLGIIHINDTKFVNHFIKEYTKLKKWYVTNVESKNPTLKYDTVIEMATCTYFLSMFLEVHKYSIGVLNKTNSFTHYSGVKAKIDLLRNIGRSKLL